MFIQTASIEKLNYRLVTSPEPPFTFQDGSHGHCYLSLPLHWSKSVRFGGSQEGRDTETLGSLVGLQSKKAMDSNLVV